MTLDQLNIETLQTTAVVENGFLRGTELLNQLDGETVQVVVIHVKKDAKTKSEYDDSELTPQQWERGVAALMAADFADDPAEDIYSREDGKPYDTTQD